MLLHLDDEHRAQSFTGVPPSAIERLPTYNMPKLKEGATLQQCSICLESRVEGELVRTLLCMHSYHAACLDPWLREHTKCPVCQFVVQL
jgi:hypothetical protein